METAGKEIDTLKIDRCDEVVSGHIMKDPTIIKEIEEDTCGIRNRVIYEIMAITEDMARSW